MIYLALNGLFGSQSTFLFNQMQSVWQSAPDGVNGVARFAIKTYTNSPADSINQVCSHLERVSRVLQALIRASIVLLATVVQFCCIG
jgi:hypothetical protein